VSEVFADAVFRWNMAVFTSAGNDGPALSSLGSPGTLTAPITVGAYVSKEMMTDQYSSLPPSDDADPDAEEGDGGNDDDSDGDGSEAFELETEAQEGASYYFSSRGPSPDGYFPDLCAPGGAIAPIPRHALQGKAQYHGTSMASPNACGVAACVLSALLHEQQQQQKEDSSDGTDTKSIGILSPVALKRALINTAVAVKPVPDSFAEGAGLINAVKAVEYLKKHGGKMGENVHFGVSIPSRNNARGIYLRDAVELIGPLTFGVLIKPRFDHAVVRSDKEMAELLDLELDLELRPSDKWVACPERMTLLSALERGGQSFNIRLDTSALSPGAHFATVSGIDASDPDRGALFQVPITVIVPHTQHLSPSSEPNSNGERSNTSDESVTLLENGIDLSMTYKLNPGAANRRFLTVPSQAEWATIKITSVDPLPSPTSPQRLLLHAIPFVRGDLPNTEIQLKRLVPLTEGIEHKYHLRVKGGSTMEVCLQSLWLANPTPTTVSVKVEYHSLSINQSSTLVNSQVVRIASAKEFARLGATAVLPRNTSSRAPRSPPSRGRCVPRRTPSRLGARRETSCLRVTLPLRGTMPLKGN
jgi:tripeptidyl-peptidase-2